MLFYIYVYYKYQQPIFRSIYYTSIILYFIVGNIKVYFLWKRTTFRMNNTKSLFWNIIHKFTIDSVRHSDIHRAVIFEIYNEEFFLFFNKSRSVSTTYFVFEVVYVHLSNLNNPLAWHIKSDFDQPVSWSPLFFFFLLISLR